MNRYMECLQTVLRGKGDNKGKIEMSEFVRVGYEGYNVIYHQAAIFKHIYVGALKVLITKMAIVRQNKIIISNEINYLGNEFKFL